MRSTTSSEVLLEEDIFCSVDEGLVDWQSKLPLESPPHQPTTQPHTTAHNGRNTNKTSSKLCLEIAFYIAKDWENSNFLSTRRAAWADAERSAKT